LKNMIAPARLIAPDLRSRCRAGHRVRGLLAILWLALTSSCAPAAPPVPERYLVYDPSATPKGAFFAIQEDILTDKAAAAATEAFGGPNAYEKARQGSREMSSDALTRVYMASFDGYLTGLIMLRFLKGLDAPPDAVNRLIQSAKNDIHLPDGSTVAVPLPRALSLHAGTMRIATESLHGREPPFQLARAYIASVKGDCPFAAGGIEITQRGFLVEGARDGRPLLAGAIGRTRATFLALEARYATITRAQEQPEEAGGPLDIDLPDQPSELYQAALEGPRITLNGLTFKDCTIVLAPA
jgi:hypothetical protein